MLSSLLPGLRDARSPILVGTLWLLAVLLAEVEGVFSAADFPPLVSALELSRLLPDVLGPAALLVITGVALYAAGSLAAVTDTSPLTLWVIGVARGRPKIGRRINGPHSTTLREYEQYINTEAWRAIELTSQLTGDQARIAEGKQAIDRLKATSMDDLSLRLLANKTDVYAFYDKVSAEASFRLNLGLWLWLPASILFLSMGGAAHVLLLLIAVALSVAFYWLGLKRVAEAEAILKRATMGGALRHPLHDHVAELGEQAKEASRQIGQVSIYGRVADMGLVDMEDFTGMEAEWSWHIQNASEANIQMVWAASAVVVNDRGSVAPLQQGPRQYCDYIIGPGETRDWRGRGNLHHPEVQYGPTLHMQAQAEVIDARGRYWCISTEDVPRRTSGRAEAR